MMPAQTQQDGVLANFASQLRRQGTNTDASPMFLEGGEIGGGDDASNGISAAATLRGKQLASQLLPAVPDKCGPMTISLG